jgi:ornithine cyclodeaminase/alanine dehydrogenase-like protein (mu-crystallin family)
MASPRLRSDPESRPGRRRADEGLVYLSSRDVERTGVSDCEIIAELAALFAEKAAGRVEAPPKLGIHPKGDSFLHAMPAHVPGRRATGMKWIGAFPGNRDRGAPQISGVIVINDPETGRPSAVLDARWVTAKRTAAASALAAKYLARPDSSTVGILGCGAQGRSHLGALCAEFRVERVVAFDPSVEARTHYAAEMQERTGVRVVATASPRDAVEACDIIVTAGPIARVPYGTVQPGWLSEGAFAASIDYASAWSAGALAEFDRIYVDDIPQQEAHRAEGYFPNLPAPFADLGEVVAGTKQGRTTPQQRLMACLLGLAAEDIVVAHLVVERAIARGIGTWLPQ